MLAGLTLHSSCRRLQRWPAAPFATPDASRRPAPQPPGSAAAVLQTEREPWLPVSFTKRVQHQVSKEREVGGGRGTTARPKEGSPLFSPHEAQPLSGIVFFINTYLFTWLCWVLVAQVGWLVVGHELSSCGLSSCSVQT